jgi:hypothetical protein
MFADFDHCMLLLLMVAHCDFPLPAQETWGKRLPETAARIPAARQETANFNMTGAANTLN